MFLQVPLSASMSPVRLHSSNPNLCAELVDYQPPVSCLSDNMEYASDYIKLQEEFCTIAQKGKYFSKSIYSDSSVSFCASQFFFLSVRSHKNSQNRKINPQITRLKLFVTTCYTFAEKHYISHNKKKCFPSPDSFVLFFLNLFV